MTSLAATTGAVETVLERFGRLDIVVANAGIQPGNRPVLEYPPADWHHVLDTNLTGVWNSDVERRWAQRGKWFKEPSEVAALALFIAALPPRGSTGQVFSLWPAGSCERAPAPGDLLPEPHRYQAPGKEVARFTSHAGPR